MIAAGIHEEAQALLPTEGMEYLYSFFHEHYKSLVSNSE